VSALELILRTVGTVQLVVLAGLMLRTRRRHHVARIGAMLCMSVGAFLLTSMPNAGKLLGVLLYPLTAICSTHPVWFWLFAAALFADGFRFTRRHLACVAGMGLAGMLYQWTLQPDWSDAVAWRVQALGLVFGGASLVFAGLAPITVFAGRRADLDERRRGARNWFVPLVTLYLAVVTVVQVTATFLGQPRSAELFVLANLALIDVLVTIAVLSFVQIRVVNWLDLTDPAPNTDSLSRLERSVLERLNRDFVPGRLYAREALTITALAELLDTQEHVLRRVINRGLGFRNFNDFLHSHRLREAAARLSDPDARRLPVLTIALESGYGSIGPFNRAFKKRFGMTPTEYRRSCAGASSDAVGLSRPGDVSQSHPA
jgi:AraC-like DNA-binding protein